MQAGKPVAQFLGHRTIPRSERQQQQQRMHDEPPLFEQRVLAIGPAHRAGAKRKPPPSVQEGGGSVAGSHF
jgi:hypothetical protein